MKQFQITLKNEKIRLYTLLSWLIIIINLILFIYLTFFSTANNTRNTSIAILIVFALCFLLKLYFRKTKYAFGPAPFFFLLMLSWISLEQYIPTAVIIVLELLSFYSLRKLIIIFSKDSIFYPSVPPKRISWNKLNNALLKDGLLTLDFKKNKLIQQHIDEKSTVINENEFNEFCRQQLETSNKKPAT